MTGSTMPRRERIYIAGPISTGARNMSDRLANVGAGIDAMRTLVAHGYAPLCPMLSHYADPTDELGWDSWLEVCLAWVRKADVVVRLPGESRGADLEVAYAQDRGIPVMSVEELLCL